ncbi:MAG: ATP-binding cassette domain-containing protein [Bradymonadales bacterium]|nr:ATP-binding cassette domain-containing protein [Bradymonadales bacterium]
MNTPEPATVSPSPPPAIWLEKVSRSYGEVQAVRRIGFAVYPGEVVGLLGPNGAGKTTTLRMMATLLKPDSGRIQIAGFDVVEQPLAVRSALGYETGDTGLYKRLKPVEFLRYFGRLHGIEKQALERRIAELVENLQMVGFTDRLCGNLSTGQQQRVSLARALLHDPQVLVLDEPTRGLDILSSSFVLESLKRAADSGRAVLFSTHIMSEVELTCSRVVVLHRGEVLAEGSISGLLERTGEGTLSRAFLALVSQRDAEGDGP